MSAQPTVLFNVHSEWASVRMNLLIFDWTNSCFETNNLPSLINSEFRIHGLLHHPQFTAVDNTDKVKDKPLAASKNIDYIDFIVV